MDFPWPPHAGWSAGLSNKSKATCWPLISGIFRLFWHWLRRRKATAGCKYRGWMYIDHFDGCGWLRRAWTAWKTVTIGFRSPCPVQYRYPAAAPLWSSKSLKIEKLLGFFQILDIISGWITWTGPAFRVRSNSATGGLGTSISR